MEITGRLTADAESKTTKSNKGFVAFTIAVNDSYKTKDGEWKEIVEFINCTYWLSTKVADSLLKSSIVTVSGRIYLNEYKGKDGNQYANLAFHVSSIKIIAAPKKNQSANTPVSKETVPADTPETIDDLPF